MMNKPDQEHEVQVEVVEPLSRFTVTVNVVAHSSDEALQFAQSEISNGEVEWIEIVRPEMALEEEPCDLVGER